MEARSGQNNIDAQILRSGEVSRTGVLSVLLHLLLLLLLWRYAGISETRIPQTLPEKLLWADLEPAPSGRVVETKRPANQEKPDRADHLARQSHALPRQQRLKNQPIRPFDGGPANPRTSTRPSYDPLAPDPYGLPPTSRLPKVSATDLLNRSSFGDYMTNRNNQSVYNPDLPEAGDAVWINTNEFKYVSYFMHLKERIEDSWKHTRPSYTQKRTGVLSMTILAGGELADVSLIESCGERPLDLAILSAIRMAAPFNPLPKAWDQPALTVNFQFHYLLDRGYSLF